MRLRSILASWGFSSFLAALIIAAGAFVGRAEAQSPPTLLSPGDAVVTGFPGVLPPSPPPPAPADPIDETFINPAGASPLIQHPQPAGPPAGPLIRSPTVLAVT